MSRYLLDTDTLIDFSKGIEPQRSRLLQMLAAGDVLAVCAVSVEEFYAGLPVEQHPIWDEFFFALPYWDISREAAKAAGVNRRQAARQGRALATADALIAATAWEHQAILLTNNAKDFLATGVAHMSLRDL